MTADVHLHAQEPWERLELLRHAGLPGADTAEGPLVFSGPLRPGGQALTAHALDACGLAPGARVLDVGCGSGDSLRLLREYGLHPLGIDLSMKQLRRSSSSKPGALLVRGNACSLPLRNASLDGILCECVLSLLADTSAALKEFHRVIKPGGKLMLTDLYLFESTLPFQRASQLRSCIEGAISIGYLEQMIGDNGFEILLLEDHTPLLKRFAAELVFAGISLADVYGTEGDPQCRAKAGYYLLIARRKAGDLHHG